MSDKTIQNTTVGTVQPGALTAIARKENFLQHLQDFLNTHKTEKWCVAAIDVEHFRLYNELYGTEQGDTLLNTLASHLLDYQKTSGCPVGYWGNDDFFLCLPDDAAREVVPLLRDDVRILDTSTAHRTAPGWVYGLPELHGTREALKTATRVAVPGCHATGFIAPVAPLVELGIIPKAAHLNVTSLTGYSGGGKKMIAEYEAERTNKALNAPRPYGLALHHKHLPEMAAVTGLDTAPNFVPVVADYYAGMETMIPLDVTALGVSAPQVASALAEYYAGQPMVKVHPLCEGTDGGFLAANKLAGKDTLEIYCLANPDGTRMQLISLFDNLGKGSSGAAVQCMNLMLGLEETEGLAR